MTKRSKAQCAERTALTDALLDAYAMLEEEISDYNDRVAEAWQRLQAVCATYNTHVAEANAWRARVAHAIQAEIDFHQETWQDSARGQRVVAWHRAYTSQAIAQTLETVAFAAPVPLDLDLSDQADALEALPESPDA